MNVKTIKQSGAIHIKNLDLIVGGGLNTIKKHGALLPNSIRCIICGPSNCGKSNVMIGLLFDENGLKYDNIYVFSKSLYQEKYDYLRRVLKGTSIGYFEYSENSEILPPGDANTNSVFIFDDVACDKQDRIKEYFSYGRHKMIDSFYLCQTYTRIPKHLIRDNANFLIIFKQDAMNVKHIYDNHVSSDMKFNEFVDLCHFCWGDKFGFLTIDKDSEISAGRYRKGLNDYICLNDDK